jgi:diguanylate cyclase (GGDEF)-like protein/PAS domain S-box-containing protein
MALISDTADTSARIEPGPGEAVIFGDQVSLLYRLSRPAYAGTLIIAAIIGLALWNVTPRPWLVIWLVLVVVVTTARYLLYKAYFAREPQPPLARSWAERFVAGAIATGCLWGLLGSVLLPAGEIMHQFLIVFAVGGMVASALVVLTPVRAAFLGFTLTALLPLTFAVFVQGSNIHIFMGVLLLVFTGVMLGTFPIMHGTHVNSLRMRFENRELVARLSQANRESGEANRQLTEQIQHGQKSEEALRQSTERLEALIEASPLAIIVQNERGVVKRWNRAAERIFGWTEQEVVGQFVPMVPADKQEEAARYRAMILRGEQFADVEAVRQRKDGSAIAVSLFAAPLRDAAGTPSGMVLIVADISERKRIEQRQNIQNAITVLLSDAKSIDEAIPRVIQTLCENWGWVAGARRVVGKQDQLLRHIESWCVPDPAVEAFMQYSAARIDRIGENAGLLRRVWATGEPVWLSDLSRETTFWRGPRALAAGLHCAFAFPILVGGEFYGVIELFGREVRPPDEERMKIAAAIGSQIGQFIARKEAETHLTFFANHDPLTGLPNRVMFNDRLTQALAQAHRYDKTAAVLFIDLDRFKVINDTLGHDAGDKLLKELALRLRDCLREGDTIARQGGDEFVVLIEDVTDPDQVSGVAQKILETVARPYMLDGQEYHVTASIGISVYPADGHDLQTLLKNADSAMYRAKEQGTNNHQFYSA